MNRQALKAAPRLTAAAILSLALVLTMAPQGLTGNGSAGPDEVYGADYTAATETALLSAVASAPDGSVITVTHDIELGTALAWDDKSLTIKGPEDGDVTISRGTGVGNSPMITVGGTNPAATTPAGLTLADITIDDADNPGGAAYDGIVAAYRTGVTITLASGASLTNGRGRSSVRLEGTAPAGPGPKLIMQDGSRIIYARSAGGSSGAGVYVGTGAAFTMEGGIIQSNRTAGAGGGVYVAGGATFLMEDGLVKGNTASAGGGVLVSGDGAGGAFVMKGGSVTGNTLAAGSGNGHGEDLAVGAPSGTDPVKRGTAPDYGDAAYCAEIFPDALLGGLKAGVENATYNQAVYIPETRTASVLIGALNQTAGTSVLDSLTAAAIAAMPPASTTYAGLTYAGSVLYAPDKSTGTVTFRLNYPDDIPAYDAAGLNVRNRYSYKLAYVALNAAGAQIGGVHLITPIRDVQNIIAEIPAISNAASYGIAKYYYDKSGALDVTIDTVSGGKIVEKTTGRGGTLHFASVPQGTGYVPSPASFTLKVTPDTGWDLDTVTLTAGDGYKTEKDVSPSGEVVLYYTDLEQGANSIKAVFVKEDGTIDLSMSDSTFTYNGRPHRVAVSGIAKGDEVAYMYRVGDSGFIASKSNPSFTDVNKVIAGGMTGVTGDEIIVYVVVTRGAVTAQDSALLTISPRAITVKPVDKKKVYDGKPLRADDAEVSVGSLVQGHSLDLSSAVFKGSRTNAGRAPSTVRGVSVSGTDPANYVISYARGRLTVTKAPDDDDKPTGGGVNPPGTGDDDNDGDEGYTDDETATGGAVVPTSGGVEPTGAGIDEPTESGVQVDPPVPPTTDGGIDIPPSLNGGFPWWGWMIIVIAAAAIALWYLLVYRRRRKEDDDEGAGEARRR